MRNLVTLITVEEIHAYVARLWKSQPFRESYNTRGFIYQQVDAFARMPRFFAESSNDQLERSHFSTWWNVIMLREYDNPYINDLYYLHEMTHAATMPYVKDIGRAAFDEKMQRNELEASVLSEIAVYFELEGLRENSFNHPIYADRYLRDGDMQNLWKANRNLAMETLRTMRRDVMVGKPEHSLDLEESWIRRFNDQNAIYFGIWADRYRDIENMMAVFQSMACTNDDDGDGFPRRAAAHLLKTMIEREAKRDPVDNIPFRLEAELFAPVYWASKAKYDAAMNKKKLVAA